MAQVERMQTECPPDAHKVIRPPENEVQATLCIRVDKQEQEKYGIYDFCQALSLMSNKPVIVCEDNELKELIEQTKAEYQLEPGYLIIDEDANDAFVRYSNGAQGQALPFFDLTKHPEEVANFFTHLGKKQFLIIDSLSMLIFRSISTVYPWDKLLAGDFLRQYQKAREALSKEDIEVFKDVRYGRVDKLSIKTTKVKAYQYARLESKLFLQYPTEDED